MSKEYLQTPKYDEYRPRINVYVYTVYGLQHYDCNIHWKFFVTITEQ